MGTNFSFLKKVDSDLFKIIDDAEKLYRDEYFEQCMTQTRRFGENVCKSVLGEKRTAENSFDEMLATLKDCISSLEQGKEFVEDLYFLKKHGNKSTHSVKVKQDGMEALECLQRAFEVAINYCVYSKGGSKNILKLQYDTELLITGQKSKKTLAEKYREEKLKTTKNTKKKNVSKPIKQSHTMSVKKKENKVSGFWVFVGISFVISFILLMVSYFLAH